MRILVGVGDQTERKRIVAILSSRYAVCEASTPTALAAMLSTKVDVAVLDTTHIKLARRAACPRIYVIALVAAQPTPSSFWGAYTAGADDVIRANACSEELVGRVEGRQRIREWLPEQAGSASAPLDDLKSWRDLETIVTADLAALMGCELAVASRRPDVIFAAELPLVLSSRSVEVTLGIGIDAAGKRGVQDLMFGGTATPELIADALREFANTAAGAFKRAALAEGVEFTIGLPRNANPFTREGGRVWVANGEGVDIACIAVASPIVPLRVVGRELREGMVLARDVMNANGMLLAPAGTYLTRNAAERLTRLIGDLNVEVTDTKRAA